MKKKIHSVRKMQAQQPEVVFKTPPNQEVVAYDENLLERSRTQWQFGDWQSLAELNRETLQHHPDRAKLALLAAAGRLQIGLDAEGTHFLRLAKDWGVSKKLFSQILIAGVHNSLGRVSAISNQQDRALYHFQKSISTGAQGSEARLLTTARMYLQCEQLGLSLAQIDLR